MENKEKLADRIIALRDGINPQPFAILAMVDPSLNEHAARCRRILCAKKIYPGDLELVERMEKVKVFVLKARADFASKK